MPDGLRNLVYGVALTVMVGWLLVVGRGVFVPVVAAILIAYVILGVAQLLARAPVLGERLSEGARFLLATALIVLVVIEAATVLAGSLAAVAARAPAYQQALLAALQSGAAALGIEREPTWESVRADLLSGVDLQRTARSVALSTLGMIGALVFVLLNVAFLLLERRQFAAKIVRMTGDAARAERVRLVIADINSRVGRYLAVKTLINIGLGLISWAIMLAAGLEFAGLWAMIIGLFNYIPYVGSFIGVFFPVAMAVAQFGDFQPVLTLLIALVIAQVMVGNVIEPQVMGNSLNLSPWVVLVSLTVWSSLWGVAGAVFSVPITAIMVVVFSEFAQTRPIAVLLSKDGEIDRA